MSSEAERLVRPEELGEDAETPVGRRVASTTGRSPFRRRGGKPKHRRAGPAVE